MMAQRFSIPPGRVPDSLATTRDVMARARGGDVRARNLLVERALPPHQHASAREAVETYRRGLQGLTNVDRQAIVARLEWQLSYEEVAALLHTPTAAAARVAVTRAIARLIEVMDRES